MSNPNEGEINSAGGIIGIILTIIILIILFNTGILGHILGIIAYIFIVGLPFIVIAAIVMAVTKK